MNYETEMQKAERKLAEHWKEMYQTECIRRQELELALARLKRMISDYEDIKRVLSMSGDDPSDYIEDLANYAGQGGWGDVTL